MNPKVVMVILNYNGWRDTIECIESIRGIDYDNFEIVLLDNGSYDDSIERINVYCQGLAYVDSKSILTGCSGRAIEPPSCSCESDGRISEFRVSSMSAVNPLKVTVIRAGLNLGFTGGNNTAVKYALKFLAPDFVLILNNDTVVRPDFLAEQVKMATSDDSIGLVQSKILRYRDSTIDNVGVSMTPLGVVFLRGKGETDAGQYNRFSESGFFFAAGTCLLVARNFLRRLDDELFDPALFAYNEDMDLSWRARMLGFRVLVCTSSICYHKGGMTSRTLGRAKDFWMFRNTIRIFMKNCALSSMVFLVPVMLFRYSSSALLILYQTGGTEEFRIFLRSIVWNLEMLSDSLCRRRYLQSTRVVSDRQIRKHMDRDSLLG